MDLIQTLGSTLGLGFLSGVRLYATVLVLGLAIRFGLFHPSAEMSTLQALADVKILIAAGVMGLLEFVADKVPWIDSIWDVVHTFVRPVAAGLLAAAALGNFDPVTRTMLAILAGGVALTSHSTKAATRLAVNHSPEPFSNMALSVAEDFASPALLWIAMAHPALALGLVAMFLVAFVFISRWVYGAMKRRLEAFRRWLSGPASEGSAAVR